MLISACPKVEPMSVYRTFLWLPSITLNPVLHGLALVGIFVPIPSDGRSFSQYRKKVLRAGEGPRCISNLDPAAQTLSENHATHMQISRRVQEANSFKPDLGFSDLVGAGTYKLQGSDVQASWQSRPQGACFEELAPSSESSNTEADLSCDSVYGTMQLCLRYAVSEGSRMQGTQCSLMPCRIVSLCRKPHKCNQPLNSFDNLATRCSLMQSRGKDSTSTAASFAANGGSSMVLRMSSPASLGPSWTAPICHPSKPQPWKTVGNEYPDFLQAV